MTTERQVDTVVGFAHAWAQSLNQSAALCREQAEHAEAGAYPAERRVYLTGMAEAYEDAARSISAQAVELQQERRDGRRARLVVVS